MKSYPLTIIDDFFVDPDYIRNLALSVDYPHSDQRWPGRRSEQIYKIDRMLFDYVGNKILSIFGDKPEAWDMAMNFQKIVPFSDDKWDVTNRGWVHVDSRVQFGGVIYLNKNPDIDTGTSIYRTKRGYNNYYTDSKEKLYSGQDFDRNQYIKDYNSYHDEFIETVKVDNVYNRFVLFGCDTYHGVRTFGTEERLTLAFFCNDAHKYTNPLLRL